MGIDAVLVPPNIVRYNIFELAGATTDLSKLVEAVMTAELDATLKVAGAFTVFAPTNAAFATILETVPDLLDGSNKADLLNVLNYHVVKGKSMQVALTNGIELETELAGGKLSVTVEGEVVDITDINEKQQLRTAWCDGHVEESSCLEFDSCLWSNGGQHTMIPDACFELSALAR